MRTDKQDIIHPSSTLGDCLRTFPQFRVVFEDLGIDSDTHADEPLTRICMDRDLDPDTVVRMLLACDQTLAAPLSKPVELLPLDVLCDHLESLHTRFHTALDQLDQAVNKAGNLPEPGESKLSVIQTRLARFRESLAKHLREEAEVSFPLIRKLDNSRTAKTGAFALLKAPLAKMRHQHDEMDEALADLDMLIDGYAQTSAHPRRQVLRDRLDNLQEVLQVQIYHENQILFRRALATLGSS